MERTKCRKVQTTSFVVEINTYIIPPWSLGVAAGHPCIAQPGFGAAETIRCHCHPGMVAEALLIHGGGSLWQLTHCGGRQEMERLSAEVDPRYTPGAVPCLRDLLDLPAGPAFLELCSLPEQPCPLSTF